MDKTPTQAETADTMSGASADDPKLISIVVPVYNESAVIDEFYARARSVLDSLYPVLWEMIFIDDGSTDDSYEKLCQLAVNDQRIKLIKFSRNFGHQIAITAGIDMSQGDAVVVIDADLQDPPEVIDKFVENWKEGFDVVYGVRQEREGETWFKLFTAHIYYRILKALAKMDIPVDVGDFRLMSKRAVRQFRQLREKDRFVRGMVSWIGFKQIGVTYRREERYAGMTKYPFHKMVKFALDGIVSFSTVPLRLASWLGYLSSILAFLYLCSVLVQKALGYTVPGFATIMVSMLFMGGVQLICLGIVGEYVGRIFNEIKPRPLYVIEETYGFKCEPDENELRLERC